jgi:hypothetical protein
VKEVTREGKMAASTSSHVPRVATEGDPIDDYFVEDHADHVLAKFKAQSEAIEWAKKNGHAPQRGSRPSPERQEEG